MISRVRRLEYERAGSDFARCLDAEQQATQASERIAAELRSAESALTAGLDASLHTTLRNDWRTSLGRQSEVAARDLHAARQAAGRAGLEVAEAHARLKAVQQLESTLASEQLSTEMRHEQARLDELFACAGLSDVRGKEP